ncbi:MAG TPA: DNA-3-methyladenine glycosylase [Gemmataceae bacterium]|nr:DNA-3-methyladenine glycosylase [Gemmataceae bacterium]
MSNPPDTFLKAQRHLARRDRVLQRLIATVGPCTLWPNPDRFGLLVRSIISQQISTRAAEAIYARLEDTLGKKGITPDAVLALPEEALRAAGLSSAKARSLRDLAAKVHSKVVPLDDLHKADDEEVIAALLPVRGIGRWTAQMFLIFSLGRLDVLPVDDFGLRSGIRQQYGLKELPDRRKVQELAEPWRPYRTVATWYLWRSLGAVPQSE